MKEEEMGRGVKENRWKGNRRHEGVKKVKESITGQNEKKGFVSTLANTL